MQPRLDYKSVAPEALKPLLQLDAYLNHSSGLEPSLLDLVRLRASQINGCAFCIDMHSKDLRARGETEQRLYELNAWRETPFYSDRKRAALEWTEAITLISQNHVPDDVFKKVHQYFSDPELVNLTMVIVAINGWNRIAISFRVVHGSYQPAVQARKTA